MTRPGSRSQRGTAIIEFALIVPFILLLVFIVIEFGRAIYEYGVVVKSVRDAARYLSIQTAGTKTTEARNLVVYGNTAGTGTPLLPALSTSQVASPTWTASGASPVIETVTVTVTGYTFTPMMDSVLGNSFGPITYSDISATMRSAL